jgi:hypothetical protein
MSDLYNGPNAPSNTVNVEPYEKILKELKALWEQDKSNRTAWGRSQIGYAITNLELFIEDNK